MKNEFRHKKNLGQHFLRDKNIVSKIVKFANIESDDIIWEIGPGHGILTHELLNYTNDIITFEIDKTLYEYLEEKFGNKFQLVKQDILKVDWQKYLNQNRKYKLVSNLPYQITTPVLFKLVEYRHFFESAVIMIQKEVAERIKAEPNTKKYGVLSLKMQFYFDIKYLFTVKPHLFYPPPKVDSAVILLSPKKEPFVLENPELFWKIVTTLFGNRRKMIRNNIKKLIPNSNLEQIEKKSGISLKKRAENLSIGDFYKLYKLIEMLLK